MKRFLLVFCLWTTVAALPVFAHDPRIEEEDWGDFTDPYVIEDATISYALYGYLENEEDIDVFELHFAEDDLLLRGEILVPVCQETYAEFYPEYVIVGEGENGLELELSFDLPEGFSILYHYTTRPSKATETRKSYISSHAGTEYYESERMDETLPLNGTYYLVVYTSDGLVGDYTLATGYREVFLSDPEDITEAVQKIRSDEWLHCEK